MNDALERVMRGDDVIEIRGEAKNEVARMVASYMAHLAGSHRHTVFPEEVQSALEHATVLRLTRRPDGWYDWSYE